MNPKELQIIRIKLKQIIKDKNLSPTEIKVKCEKIGIQQDISHALRRFIDGETQPNQKSILRFALLHDIDKAALEKMLEKEKHTVDNNILKIGFTANPLNSPIIMMLANERPYHQANTSSYLKENGEPILISTKESLKPLNIKRVEAYKKDTDRKNENGPICRICTENDLADFLLQGKFDAIALPEGHIETNQGDEIKSIAKIAFGMRGVCLPCLIGPSRVIEKLEKASSEPNENFTFQNFEKILLDTQSVEKRNTSNPSINIVFVRDNISATLYKKTYFNKIGTKKDKQEKVEVKDFYCSNNLNLERLLITLYNIKEYGVAEKDDSLINKLSFKKIKEKARKSLEQSDDLFIILFWHPQLHWLKNEINKNYTGTSALIHELADLFPEITDPLVSCNIYTRSGDFFPKEKKGSIDNLFTSLDGAIKKLNESLELCRTIDSSEKIRRQLPLIGYMSDYLAMDTKDYTDVCQKLTFNLVFEKSWVRFLNEQIPKKDSL